MSLVSLVIPVYFNEANIPHTWKAVRSALAGLPADCSYEIVFVDDGSGDRSYEKLTELHEAFPDEVRVVKLTRNFGQTAAVLAGFRAARGDCVVVMSADLQDPPELILEMVRRWAGGDRKIVLATRSWREDGAIARWTSRVFYRLMRRYAVPSMPEGGFDFFLVDRCVVDLVNSVDEKNTFLQGHILWTGYEPETIPYVRRRREIGKSRWTLAMKLKYFVDGFVSYTLMPIRLITLIGLIVSVLSFAYATAIFLAKLFWEIPIEGWAPTMIAILMSSGIHLMMLGIIGEYLWRNYHQTRNLPNFVVERVLETSGRDQASPDSSSRSSRSI